MLKGNPSKVLRRNASVAYSYRLGRHLLKPKLSVVLLASGEVIVEIVLWVGGGVGVLVNQVTTNLTAPSGLKMVYCTVQRLSQFISNDGLILGAVTIYINTKP